MAYDEVAKEYRIVPSSEVDSFQIQQSDDPTTYPYQALEKSDNVVPDLFDILSEVKSESEVQTDPGTKKDKRQLRIQTSFKISRSSEESSSDESSEESSSEESSEENSSEESESNESSEDKSSEESSEEDKDKKKNKDKECQEDADCEENQECKGDKCKDKKDKDDKNKNKDCYDSSINL